MTLDTHSSSFLWLATSLLLLPIGVPADLETFGIDRLDSSGGIGGCLTTIRKLVLRLATRASKKRRLEEAPNAFGIALVGVGVSRLALLFSFPNRYFPRPSQAGLPNLEA